MKKDSIEVWMDEMETSQFIINKKVYKGSGQVCWDITTRKAGYDYKGFDNEGSLKSAILDCLLRVKAGPKQYEG